MSYTNDIVGTGRGFSRTPAGKDHNNANANKEGASNIPETTGAEDELQKMRFNRHFTAFDVNIEALPEHPWRDKNVDVSDYFNYGFTERTWLVSLNDLHVGGRSTEVIRGFVDLL